MQHAQINWVVTGTCAVIVMGLGWLLATGTLLAQARPRASEPAPAVITPNPVSLDLKPESRLTIGKAAPAFCLEAIERGEFRTVSLGDYKGKWLVVFFYPLDFTFVCPTEICAFSDRAHEFRECGAEVVGVSIDSKFTHLAWTQRPRREGGIDGLAFPLLADVNKQMSRVYGVLCDDGVALRGLFLIDPDGVVQHATVNNLSVGRSVDETLRVLRAFQHVREHGDVCPADWEPGHRTINPDVRGAKAFFSNSN